ncbi:unnamed protein product [Paramecium octaurelia]|uniref:ABC transporter domain-containing protein n=1 Tax=Paramecium octaurelia TaxID=43137 RepID=A0A8S1X6K7_PAROT|nr:unnamed protein product [Paramecium octaurelia]
MQRIHPDQEVKGLKVVKSATTNVSSKTFQNRKAVDLVFEDIHYSVQNGKTERVILDHVSGICPGGQTTAILGSSGAGKTSLLNVLACRIVNNKHCKLTGELYANQDKYNYDKFSEFASYVMQNDVLLETMTPKEAFTFVSSLKYNDEETKKLRVDETIKSMRLEKCQNSRVGGAMVKGISGGERKRTSIGYELVSNPSVILLDEPTSGLDSFTAFQIIHQLKLLAKDQDKTIIFTIHQPSSDIFLLFDKIMLLVQGKLIYQGDRCKIISYFKSFGFECPTHSNPMDYLISITHSEDPKNVEAYSLYFQNYELQLANEIRQEINNRNQSIITYKSVETTISYQIGLLTRRCFVNFSRDDMQMNARIGSAIFQGLLHGGVFWKAAMESETISDVRNIEGSLYFLCVNFAVGSMMQVVLGFAVEREVFLREENSKLYSAFSYFIGKQFVEVPFCILQPLILQLISYWMIGYNDQDASIVIINFFICILLCICSNSLGLMVGCAFRDIKLALTAVPIIMMPVILLSGYMANSKNFPVWFGWLQYLSPVRYAYEAISLNEFTNRSFQTDPRDLYDFHIGMWNCIYILIGFIVGFRIFGYYFLKGLRERLQ